MAFLPLLFHDLDHSRVHTDALSPTHNTKKNWLLARDWGSMYSVHYSLVFTNPSNLGQILRNSDSHYDGFHSGSYNHYRHLDKYVSFWILTKQWELWSVDRGGSRRLRLSILLDAASASCVPTSSANVKWWCFVQRLSLPHSLVLASNIPTFHMELWKKGAFFFFFSLRHSWLRLLLLMAKWLYP